jgi:hypothetical protein
MIHLAKLKLLIISLTIISSYNLLSQTFETYYTTSADDYVYDAIIINNSETVFAINIGDFWGDDYQSKLIKINHFTGQLIDSVSIPFQETGFLLQGVSHLFYTSSSVIIAFSPVYDINNNIYASYFAHFNEEFDFIFDTLISGESRRIFDMHLFNDSIFYLTGIYEPFFQFIEERDLFGNLIRGNTFNFNAHLSSTIYRTDLHYHLYLHFDTYHRYALISIDDLSIDTVLQYPQGFSPRNAIQSNDNDYYFVAGRQNVMELPVPPQEPNKNLSFLKMNQYGDIVNVAEYHTDSINYYTIHSFSLNEDYIFFGGTQMLTWPAMHEFFMFPGPRWLLLYKLTHDGDVVWQKFYKGEVDYMMYKVLATPDGGALIFSTRYDWNDPIPYQRDVHILKVDSDGNYLVGVDEVRIEAKQILVYPNPAKDMINFAFGLYNKLEISIFDNQGRLLHSNTYQQSANIDIATFRPGMYFYTIQGSNGFAESGKFIKQ